MKKAGGNWVEGDDFFDREAELKALMPIDFSGPNSRPSSVQSRSDGSVGAAKGSVSDVA